MANHAYRDSQTANAGEVVISGKFEFNGASDPTTYAAADGYTSTNLPNGIASIVHTATGRWTITFTNPWFTCTGANVTLQLGTADDKVVSLSSFSNLNSTTAPSVEVRCWDISGAALVDPASSNEDGVYFTFHMKRSASV